MQKAWYKSMTAAVGVLGLSATTALADPAGMVMTHPSAPAPQPATSSWSFWPWSKSATAAPSPQPIPPVAQAVPPAPPMAPMTPATPTIPMASTPAMAPSPANPAAAQFPSQLISPWKHPVAYMEASIAEMPGVRSKPVAAHPVMQPIQSNSLQPVAATSPTAPPTPEFFIFAAQICEKQGDIPQSRENLKRALSMWPGNSDLLRAAARLEDRQGNLPFAESLYQQAVNSSPQNAAALNDLGLCLAREGKLDQSLQAIEKAIQIQPDKALYRNNAATVLVEMHQDQQALAHLCVVHNQADANFNLGQLLVDRGRAADAAPYFQAALQQNPNMQQAQDALNKLGAQTTVAQSTPVTPAVTAPATTPAAPSFTPQQPNWTAGPQLSYPATARTPGTDASSYVPPRYLPPIASQPGPPGVMQR